MNRNALKIFFLCTMAAAAFIVFIVSINAGYSHLPLADIFKGLLGNGESSTRLIIQQIRLPRILVSLLCGAGLGLSGCILQSVTGNPLADPVFPDLHCTEPLLIWRCCRYKLSCRCICWHCYLSYFENLLY